jgi:hypothetical protein
VGTREGLSVLPLFQGPITRPVCAVIAGVYTMMISYVSLSLLKLYGIARPLQARATVRVSTCVRIAIARWAGGQ